MGISSFLSAFGYHVHLYYRKYVMGEKPSREYTYAERLSGFHDLGIMFVHK